MVEAKVKSPYTDWSPLLRRAVLDDIRQTSREAVRGLGDEDVKVLRKLAAEKEPASGIRLDKVLAALAARAPDAATAKVMENILDDTERPAVLRTVVAIEMSRFPAETAEKALLKHVADTDDQVAQRVIQSLGMVGSTKALKALEAMLPPDNRYVRRQWGFSKRLIRHRLGKRSEKPSQVKGTTWDAEGPGQPRPLALERIEPERLKVTVEGLRDQVFGTEVAADRGYRVSVDRSLQHVLIAKELATAKGIKRLGEAPMVAAVIAMWEPRTDRPVLDQIVLTEPAEDGVLVQGFRPDGTLLFEGHGTLQRGGAAFSIASVARAGQCRFRVTGALNADGLSAHAELLPRQQPRQTYTLNQALK